MDAKGKPPSKVNFASSLGLLMNSSQSAPARYFDYLNPNQEEFKNSPALTNPGERGGGEKRAQTDLRPSGWLIGHPEVFVCLGCKTREGMRFLFRKLLLGASFIVLCRLAFPSSTAAPAANPYNRQLQQLRRALNSADP